MRTTTTIFASVDVWLLQMLTVLSLLTSVSSFAMSHGGFGRGLGHWPDAADFAGSARASAPCMDLENSCLDSRWSSDRLTAAPRTPADFVLLTGRERTVAGSVSWRLMSSRAVGTSFDSFDEEHGERAGHVAVAVAAPRRLLSASELSAALAEPSGGLPTVLLFGAKTCRMCRRLQPLMEKAARDTGARFWHIQHDSSTDELFEAHRVTHTPTVLLYDGAKELVHRAVYGASEVQRLASMLGAMAA
jgi:Thioredoxin